MPGASIPGAPGFFFPTEMTPEEQAAYLARLRFGSSLFKSGQNMSPSGDISSSDPDLQAMNAGPASGFGEPAPATFANFLKMTQTQEPSQNGSYTRNMVAKMGRQQELSPGEMAPSHAPSTYNPSDAVPQNEAEYERAYPSNVYDLPADVAKRKEARAGFKQQGEQKVAEQEAASKAERADVMTEYYKQLANLRATEEELRRSGKWNQRPWMGVVGFRPNGEPIVYGPNEASAASPAQPPAAQPTAQPPSTTASLPGGTEFSTGSDNPQLKVVAGVTYRKVKGGWQKVD